MHDNVTEAGKMNKPIMPSLFFQFPISLDNPSLFQNFFLSQDHNQDEAIESGKIGFGETTQHLMGKFAFIKHNNQETLESQLKTKKEKEPNFWYFTHC
jgi:hypothetical protein